MKKSDKQTILNYLQENGSLTPLEAWEKFNILTALRSRISELRKEGYNIVTTMVSSNGKSFASYKLIKQPTQLKIF